MAHWIQFQDVTKEYATGGKVLRAVDRASFAIGEGELVVVLGPSGAGKSTVLNLLGGMDAVTSGEITVRGERITGYRDDALADYRAKHIGFVFQFYNLIPTLTALENVALTADIVKTGMRPEAALAAVGLQEHLHKFPPQLSGGEQQRVSIARAICKNPSLLLCDEPTGALDSETGVAILALLQNQCRTQKKTVVIVTHNALLAQMADRVLRMRNGRVTQCTLNPAPVPASEVAW